jgi:predicted site-specific integrase-resolvase
MQVERQLAAKNRLFGDPLVDLKTAQLVLGGVCYSTLRRWIKLGILPTVRFGRRGHYRVRQSVLDSLLAKGEEQSAVKP